MLALAAAIGTATPATAAERPPVDLELVLAIDVSGSVDSHEAKLQRDGYIAAFRDAEVVRAIRSGMVGRIAVLYLEWASAHENRVVLDWQLVSDAASAAAFADRLAAQPPMRGRRTSIAAAIEFAMSCCFEMIVINAGVYEYWGPHVLRVFNYPLIIATLETVQVMCFSVAAAHLRRHADNALQLLALFVIFPAFFIMGNLGVGGPTVIALHLDSTSPGLVYAGTLTSLVFAVVAIRLAAAMSGRLASQPALASASSTSPAALVRPA